jgi:hypothetical protein
MDYEQVYYVTGDNIGRNATPVVVDHRTGTRVPARPTSMIAAAPPAAVSAPAWAPNTTPYQYPQPAFYGPTVMPSSWTGYPVQPPYVMPPVTPASNLATILGGFGDVGSLANIVAQVFAAFPPLPAAPTPQDAAVEGDSAASAAVNSSNLIRYQNALALFARRDQQILTLGSVLKELFKRPSTVTG